MNDGLDITVLWWLTILLQAWIAYRIFGGELGQAFRNFGFYLVSSSIVGVYLFSLSFFTNNRNVYGYSFILWAYIGPIFQFLIVRELSANVFDRFPAIRAASRITLNAFWMILILVGGAWFVYLNSLGSQKRIALLLPAVRYQESASLGFTLFVLLLLAFLSWMPVPLSRNQLNHSFLMGALFLVISLSRFALELGSITQQKRVADYISMVGVLGVLLVWNHRIRIASENSLNTPKGPIDPAAAAVMIGRLEELNQTLARSGPKSFR